jgi:phage terminase large subunit GpA-like protein
MTNAAEQLSIIDQRMPVPAWFPRSWRNACAGQVVEVRVPAAARRRLHRPKKMTPSEVSMKFRRMPAAEANPGKWRPEFARHSLKVMDAWAQPHVREVWFCGVDQASKTNTMLSCIAWAREQRPGNIFYQMPDQSSADKIISRKMIPMLKESPRLSRHLSARADDTALRAIIFADGMAILPAWAGSATSTATFAALYTFSDEVDKMEMVGKEASPIDRIRKRGRAKKFDKHMFASTPAGKYIYAGTMACQQVWEGTVLCPECGQPMRMHEEQVTYPQGASVEDIKADPSCVEYACDKCGSLLDEEAREQAYKRVLVDHDGWVCIKGESLARPKDIGFILSGFPLPDVTLEDIAIKKILAESGNLSAKRDLAHSVKAMDYEPELSERKEDGILTLCDDRDAGIVHPSSDMLTITIDTQDKGFWYEIRGWEYGPSLTSWLVKAGFVPSARFDDFSALDKLLFEDKYFGQDGREYKIGYGMIDSGGHRTREVYAWCKRSGIFATKGAQGRKVHPVSVTIQDYYPGSNVKIPGGMKLYTLDTHWHKDILADKLTIDPSDAGAWLLHSGYSAIQREMMKRDPATQLKNGLTTYAQHFSVEYKNDKNLWEQPAGKRNDLWDCAQMSVALAYYLGFDKMAPEKARKQPQTQQSQSQQPQSTATGRPGWFHNRGR